MGIFSSHNRQPDGDKKSAGHNQSHSSGGSNGNPQPADGSASAAQTGLQDETMAFAEAFRPGSTVYLSPENIPSLWLECDPNDTGSFQVATQLTVSEKSDITLQLQVADMLRRRILLPDLPLNLPLPRTHSEAQKAADALTHLIEKGRIPAAVDELSQQAFIVDVLDEAFGLGPLDGLMQVAGVSEIMVNGPHLIFVTLAGRLYKTGRKFLDSDHLERTLERIILPLGVPADFDHPLVDLPLPNGSCLNAKFRPNTLFRISR